MEDIIITNFYYGKKELINFLKENGIRHKWDSKNERLSIWLPRKKIQSGVITKEDFLSNTKPLEVFAVFETFLNYLKTEFKRYENLAILNNDKWIVAENIVKNWRED